MNKIKEFVKNNKIVVSIVGGVLVIGAVVASVLVIKSKKDGDLAIEGESEIGSPEIPSIEE